MHFLSALAVKLWPGVFFQHSILVIAIHKSRRMQGMVIYFLQYMLFFLFPGQYNDNLKALLSKERLHVNFITLESEVWC